MEKQYCEMFNTHTVFVVIRDKYYKLNKKDLSREEVSEIPEPSREKPIIVLNKVQFDMVKTCLLNVQSPFRINLDIAEMYNRIGFLTDEELKDYKGKLEKLEAESADEIMHNKTNS